jgi:uncharacterized protein (TIGR04222 family)
VSGPVFLVIYVLLAIAVNVWLRYDQRQREAAQPARFMEIAQDPYQLAYLREGASEATRLAIFSLLDRGLLEEANGSVRCARADAASFARRPIEKAVLASCSGWAEVATIETAYGVTVACQSYKSVQQEQHLLADASTFSARFFPFVAAVTLLVGVAVARALWAVGHGRHNIGFLLIFSLIGGIALAVAWRKRRTGLGDAALDRLKLLFAKLKRRANDLVPGGQSNDAVLAAALFGMAILPVDSFPYLERVFPKPKSSGDSSSGGDSGSSDGDGGGGGCGGGCGGCGG